LAPGKNFEDGRSTAFNPSTNTSIMSDDERMGDFGGDNYDYEEPDHIE
jgi:hypothetical protein